MEKIFLMNFINIKKQLLLLKKLENEIQKLRFKIEKFNNTYAELFEKKQKAS